jgi:drug/metabolite transporter (DMT)-like permease
VITLSSKKSRASLKFLIALPLISSVAYAFWALLITESISFYGSNYVTTLLIIFIVSAAIALSSALIFKKKMRRRPERFDVLAGVFYAIGNVALFSVVNSKSLLVVYAVSYMSVLFFLFDGKNIRLLASSGKKIIGITAAILVIVASVIYLYISFNSSSPSSINLFSVSMGLVAAVFYAIGGMLSVRVSYERESIPSKWFWISVTEAMVTFIAVLAFGFKATEASIGISALAGVAIIFPFALGFISYTYTKYLRGVRKVVDKEIIYSIPELDILWLAILYGVFIKFIGLGDFAAIGAMVVSIIYLYTLNA